MSQKRPRILVPAPQPAPGGSKLAPDYWVGRLFKSIYTYQGQRREVRHWSVKIQYQGQRKVFALSSGAERQAAEEACRLYQAITEQGWGAVNLARWQRKPAGPFLKAYWEQRLVRRKYAMGDRPDSGREFSVRIEQGGVFHHFLLETEDAALAAERAARIYRCIATEGWAVANRQYRRELTVACRWLDNPLVWTYTTIHTQIGTEAVDAGAAGAEAEPAGALEVAVVEPDAGIRRALAWCINQFEGVRCHVAVASPGELAPWLARRPFRLVLLNHNAAAKPDGPAAEGAWTTEPPVARLWYTVTEDSEELFKTTPGGGPFYLLRRTPATRLLEPIEARLRQQPLTSVELAAGAWQYFKAALAVQPSKGLEWPLSPLTQREQEVLALLSKGHADKEIASRLGISIHTVHEHVRHTFEKLGVHNRIEAVVRYLQK